MRLSSALKIRAVAALMLASTAARAAQEVYAVAGLAQPLQEAGVSARAFAMGTAMAGLADDATALFFNPAGLGGLRDASVGFHHHSGLVDTVQETAMLGLPIGSGKGMAAAVDYISYGNFDTLDETGTKLGSFTTDEIHVDAGYGQRLLGGLSLGAQIHTNQERIGDLREAGWGGNIGALLETGLAGVKLGADLAGNSDSGLAGFQISDFRLGASTELFNTSHFPLILALAGEWPSADQGELQVGAELGISHGASVRAGWREALYQVPDSERLGLFSAGAGLNSGVWSLDYGFIFNHPLGFMQRVSLSYVFGQAAPAVDSARTPKESPPPDPFAGDPAPRAVPAAAQAAAPAPRQEIAARQSYLKYKVLSDDYVRGSELEAKGSLMAALDAYRTGVKADPKDEACWSAMAGIYDQLHKADYTRQCYQEVVRLNPANAEAREWLKKDLASKP